MLCKPISMRVSRINNQLMQIIRARRVAKNPIFKSG